MSLVVILALLLAGGCSQLQYSGAGEHSVPRLSAATAADGDNDEVPALSVVDPQPVAGWLTLAKADVAAEANPAAAPAQAGQFVPWQQRRGPAYPGDFWRSFGRDAKELLPSVWDDTKATFTDKWTLVALGSAAAIGAILDATNSNGSVADCYTHHGSQLNDFWDEVGDVGGNPGTHFAVAGAMYFTALARGDVKNYEVSKTLLNALAINGLTTLALKAVCQSDSPNGDPWGWPSGHTSSTFCFATVMYEAYGPWVGVPAFAFASYVGYERIDARNHDFNDVISGAIIGVAIGHAVFQNHQPRVFGMDVQPYADPQSGTMGLALSKSW
jgi:hypothetical protein